jgi:NTP pyrophosphatase (non-canonical NTP hydrolase)
MDDATWDTVERLVAWLDDNIALTPEATRLLRVLKLSEEVGEVSEAVIGVLGQNPRKGVTHAWSDVHDELCDVILTAMVALSTLTSDARRVFAARVAHVAERSLDEPAAEAAVSPPAQCLDRPNPNKDATPAAAFARPSPKTPESSITRADSSGT